MRLFNQSLPSTSENISYFGVLLSINLGMAGLVIIVNVIISCIYHRKFLKMCLDDKPVPSDKQPTKDMSYSEKETQTDDSAGISPDEITFNERILSTILENIISLRNSMIEGIQSTTKTIEDEVNRQTIKKEGKLERSKTASKCDIGFFLVFFFFVYGAAYACIMAILFYGKPNIA